MCPEEDKRSNKLHARFAVSTLTLSSPNTGLLWCAPFRKPTRFHSSGETQAGRKMGEEEARRGGGRDLSDNPLTAHLVVVRMENVSDNLKLLDYERGFCKGLNFKPIPR